jgi:hypothetical protein
MSRWNPRNHIVIPEDIRDYIHYNPDTGECIWKKRLTTRTKIGGRADMSGAGGQRVIRFRNRLYYVARVAWFLYYGEDPAENKVERRNDNLCDNRINNLYLVSRLTDLDANIAKVKMLPPEDTFKGTNLDTIPIPEDIGEWVAYDPDTGIMMWKKSKGHRVRAGGVIGYPSGKEGYLAFQFNRRKYKVQRVAWFLHYGEDPHGWIIDHKDGNILDNRIDNLRKTSFQVNTHNAVPAGVHFCNTKQRWIAQICVNHNYTYLGSYETKEEAEAAYLKAKNELHPQALRHK